MTFTEKRDGRVGIFIPIFGGDFSQSDAKSRLAKNFEPSGTSSTPYELVGAKKDDSAVWDQNDFASGNEVLLGSTISGHTGTVVFSRPLNYEYDGKKMDLKIGGKYNLAVSWAVMYPSQTKFTDVSYSANGTTLQT